MRIQPKHTHLQWRQQDTRTTPRTRLAAAAPGCSSRSLRGPLWLWGPTPHLTPDSLGAPKWSVGPRPRKVLSLCVLFTTGRSEQCRPSRLRATGDAVHRETGCYGNLRRMEPGTAVTLNSVPCLLLRWQRGPCSSHYSSWALVADPWLSSSASWPWVLICSSSFGGSTRPSPLRVPPPSVFVRLALPCVRGSSLLLRWGSSLISAH